MITTFNFIKRTIILKNLEKNSLIQIILINNNKFIKRIIGLTSYFRSAQEQLMPFYDDTKFNTIYRNDKYQLGVYEKARIQERKIEENNKKKAMKKAKNATAELYDDSALHTSFSRALQICS